MKINLDLLKVLCYINFKQGEIFMKIFITVFCILLTTSFVFAGEKFYGNFNDVEYIRNYDGDTVTFCIPDVHPIIGRNINVRVYGIDCPEIRGKCQYEKDRAIVCRDYVKLMCISAKRIDLRNTRRGKYFRIVADVYLDNVNLSTKLIYNNFAVRYNGKCKKKNWCDWDESFNNNYMRGYYE